MQRHNLSAAFAAALLAGMAPAQLDKGARAPTFDVKKVWNDGPSSFEALQGKVVLFEFFATW